MQFSFAFYSITDCYILDLTDICLKVVVLDFRKKVFDSLCLEVQEKLKKTEKMYSICTEMLTKGHLSLPDETGDDTACITPPRN